MSDPNGQSVNEAIKRLRYQISGLIRCLDLQNPPDLDEWTHAIDAKLLPKLHPEQPLLAAVCGGGSSGKSTLFNTLIQETVSPVGGRAGINRRVLLAGNAAYFENKERLAAVFEPFGSIPEPLTDSNALTEPGPPFYASSDHLPPDLTLMDTPDFDTGARGAYINRQAARFALEVSDIFIYIFTNANYSNRDNTDFIAKMLTGIGMRKCFLVYRVYPSFQEDEVLGHAMTVAENIYGQQASDYILGIYRADEDNQVASGEKMMSLRPARSVDLPLSTALSAIDRHQLRLSLHASIIEDVIDTARGVADYAALSREMLHLYMNAVKIVQNQCTHESLRHFPTDALMRRFSNIWLASDPPHIRFMRKTGSVLEWPIKTAARAILRSKDGRGLASAAQQETEYTEQVKEDLLTSVNRLYREITNPEITVSIGKDDPTIGRMVASINSLLRAEPAVETERLAIKALKGKGRVKLTLPLHPSLIHIQEKLRDRDWNLTLKQILNQKETIISLSEGITRELQELAAGIRDRMGTWDKIRQSFSAFLNVLPATAAVTYILHTGDPVGATGIKVKLTGLFGLKDLYALIAIPATSGMKRADQKQLEILLQPVAAAWFNVKLQAVHQLLENEVTGEFIHSANFAIDQADQLLADTEANLKRLNELPLQGDP